MTCVMVASHPNMDAQVAKHVVHPFLSRAQFSNKPKNQTLIDRLMPIIKNRAIDQRWLAEKLKASDINLTSVVHFIRRNAEQRRRLETDPWKPKQRGIYNNNGNL